MPYHAANKLNNLKQNPQFTYADAVKSQPGGKKSQDRGHRKVTDLVGQTYDPTRLGPYNNGKALANVKDEIPGKATEVKGPDGKYLSGQERYDRSNVSPVPDRESRREFH